MTPTLEFVSDHTFHKNPNIKFSARTYYGPHSALIMSYAEKLNDLWPLVLSEFHITYPPVVRFANLRGELNFGICYGFGPAASSLIMLDCRPHKNSGFDEVLQDLCHELTHAEQWSRGDMSRNEANEYFWKGVRLPYTQESLNALNEEEYRKLPWEAEAYSREVSAYQSIVHQMHF